MYFIRKEMTTMNAEEKAKELIERFNHAQCILLQKGGVIPLGEIEWKISKQCALICVDEIIKEVLQMDEKWHDNEDAPLTSVFNYSYEYWQQVRKEIDKL